MIQFHQGKIDHIIIICSMWINIIQIDIVIKLLIYTPNDNILLSPSSGRTTLLNSGNLSVRHVLQNQLHVTSLSAIIVYSISNFHIFNIRLTETQTDQVITWSTENLTTPGAPNFLIHAKPEHQ